MEMVGVGGTTAKQPGGDGLTRDLTSGSIRNSNGSHDHDSAHNDEHGPNSDPDVSSGTATAHNDEDEAAVDEFEENQSDIESGSELRSRRSQHSELRSRRSQRSSPSITITPSIITLSERYDTDTHLPKDTFTFLIIYSRVCSGAFGLATSVFLLQIAIYIVLAVDITDLYFGYNRLHFPANVETSVRIAEALAGVVAVITQDDTRKAVNLLREGFDPSSSSYLDLGLGSCFKCLCFNNINQDLKHAFPGITRTKWGLSIFLRFFEGAFGLFLTFLLIMQSTTVIELLLNFTAMEFVSRLDDVVFVLTKEGFFGMGLQMEAKKVLNTSYPSRLHSKSKCKFYFLFWLGFFFGMYGWIVWKQERGHYFCHNIFAQFGDEVMPILGTLSGLFHQRQRGDAYCHYGGRVSFFRHGKDGEALLAYCEGDERWTISLPSVNVIPTKDGKKCEDNPCNKYDPCNWIAASSVTKDFNVLTTANSEWIVRAGPKRFYSLSQHFLACHDCIYTEDFCGEKEQFGECDANRWEEQWNSTCECNTGHYGFQCEYQPCQHLEISQRGKSFEKQDGFSSFASKYYRLEGVKAYNRPIYTSASLDEDQMLSDGTDIILFTGVRWILSSKDFFPGLKDNKNVSEYFSHFHGHFTDYNASYVSEPVYIGKLDDEASPSGLQWLHASYSGGVSNKEFDQRLQLQPDLQKGSIAAEFCCGNCSNVE